MSKEKQQKQEEPCEAEETLKANGEAAQDSGNGQEVQQELSRLKNELEEKTKQSAEYLEKLQRAAAEFENYKKRTAKEKEALYLDAVSDIAGTFIPVMDNLERALQAIPEDSAAQTLKTGVEMVFKQLQEAFKNIGVEEIKVLNETFDPMLHNAVMHVEDEAYGHNMVIEEFQKGYKCKDKVIRYSMVKVAN